MTDEELLKVIEEAAASKATSLDLNFNKLTALPPEICQLSRLRELYLGDNPLTSPPIEIAEQGIEAIRQYFVALEEESQPLNEVKLLLIGDGAAGKTSLTKRLLGQTFNPNEDTTHGIRIKSWRAEAGDKAIKVNIWDFGGQEIMHATHQFFLSRRSLYVLVLDGRRDERPEYWLRHIESFGGDSPVLIVLNKHDSHPGFDLNRPFLLQKYPSVKGFIRTSCATGHGITKFRKTLLRELARVEMLETRWPGSWFRVKERLEKMREPYSIWPFSGSPCGRSTTALRNSTSARGCPCRMTRNAPRTMIPCSTLRKKGRMSTFPMVQAGSTVCGSCWAWFSRRVRMRCGVLFGKSAGGLITRNLRRTC